MSNPNKQQIQYSYPIISGVFAFMAGFAGKLAFSDEISQHLKDFDTKQLDLPFEGIVLVLRVIAGILMLYLNSLMIKFFLKSLQTNGATLTTVMNFSFNFLLSGLSGFLFFKEKIRTTWIIGISLVLTGVIILSKSKESKAKTA